jgi:hypothetical protein
MMDKQSNYWHPKVFNKEGVLWKTYPYWIWILGNLLVCLFRLVLPWYWLIHESIRRTGLLIWSILRILYIGWAYKDGNAESNIEKAWPVFTPKRKTSKPQDQPEYLGYVPPKPPSGIQADYVPLDSPSGIQEKHWDPKLGKWIYTTKQEESKEG